MSTPCIARLLRGCVPSRAAFPSKFTSFNRSIGRTRFDDLYSRASVSLYDCIVCLCVVGRRLIGRCWGAPSSRSTSTSGDAHNLFASHASCICCGGFPRSIFQSSKWSSAPFTCRGMWTLRRLLFLIRECCSNLDGYGRFLSHHPRPFPLTASNQPTDPSSPRAGRASGRRDAPAAGPAAGGQGAGAARPPWRRGRLFSGPDAAGAALGIIRYVNGWMDGLLDAAWCLF